MTTQSLSKNATRRLVREDLIPELRKEVQRISKDDTTYRAHAEHAPDQATSYMQAALAKIALAALPGASKERAMGIATYAMQNHR